MTILVLGGTGATGRLLVTQLLERDQKVKVIVRSADRLPVGVKNHPNLTVIEATVLDLCDAELIKHAAGCEAVASCLGHNLTFRGLFGHPRKLVRDAVRRICAVITATNPAKPVKMILMNTTGNSNGDLDESIPFGQKIVLGLIRALIPPQSDNEQAADHLRVQIGQSNPHIQWAAVRPDSLINEAEVSEYTTHPSPTRNPIFDAGKTSRINVAHFMADLIANEDLWQQWKGKMPVIYNQGYA